MSMALKRWFWYSKRLTSTDYGHVSRQHANIKLTLFLHMYWARIVKKISCYNIWTFEVHIWRTGRWSLIDAQSYCLCFKLNASLVAASFSRKKARQHLLNTIPAIAVWSLLTYRLLDSLVVECWLRVLGGPGFNPPTRTASYQRSNKNGTSSSLVWHSTLKGKYWLFLNN